MWPNDPFIMYVIEPITQLTHFRSTTPQIWAYERRIRFRWHPQLRSILSYVSDFSSPPGERLVHRSPVHTERQRLAGARLIRLPVLPVPVAGGVRMMVMVRFVVQAVVDAAVRYLFSVSAPGWEGTNCDYFRGFSCDHASPFPPWIWCKCICGPL